MDKKILQKATNPSNEDLSGWMYSLISKMTEKSPQTAQNVSQYLIKRLNQNNVNTKRKTLQVIAYLADKGSYAFVEETLKQEAKLREMSDFRGQKDPLHGDALNQKIRTAAQKAIQQLYASAETRQSAMRQHEAIEKEAFDPSAQASQQGYFSRWTSGAGGNINTGTGAMTSATQQPQSSMFQGVGGGEYSNHVEDSSVTSSQSQHMGSVNNSMNPQFQGYGNPDFGSHMGTMSQNGPNSADGKDSETWKDWGLKKISSWKKNNNKPYAVNPDDYPNFLNQESKSYVPPGAPNGIGGNAAPAAGGGRFMPPLRKSTGGASGTSEWGISSQKEDNSASNNNNGDDTSSQNANDESQDEDYESKVVEDLCSSTGVRVQPTRQELRLFAQKCANLDGARLAESLDEKLAGKQKWQIRLKALCAIDALIQSNNNPQLVEYFEHNFENIGKQTEAVQASVSKKATSILNALNLAEDDEEDNQQQQQNASFNHKSTSNGGRAPGSLLDFGENAQEESQSKQVTSLFSNMNLKTASKPQQQQRKTSQSSNKSNGTSLLPDDIFADDEKTPEDEQKEQHSRDRSNSKRSILDTLDHFMTPTSPNSAGGTQSPVNAPTFNNNNPPYQQQQHRTNTPHTVPIHSPYPTGQQNYPTPQQQHYQPQPFAQQQRRGPRPMGASGMPQRVTSPQQQNHNSKKSSSEGGFDFLNKKNSNEGTDKHFSFVDQMLRKGGNDASSKKDSNAASTSSFSFINK